ncbi:hypothetical protein MU1_16490 [Paenibacillus glycanilyticus]|uniref:Uridine kinase n=1 Tax=Paenibacillus glycanilyticus TaxID=126569 RepID=A0ABQ6G8L7_9BACL|nr:hypothetical protein MU1_16490 [Paenibacillus glycanilyticus]
MDKNTLTHESREAVKAIVSGIKQRLLLSRTSPLVVSIDGGSGAGKSILNAVDAYDLIVVNQQSSQTIGGE